MLFQYRIAVYVSSITKLIRMRQQNYLEKAIQVIQGLTPPKYTKLPQSILNMEYNKIKNTNIKKELSFNSIKKHMNPMQRNIQTYSHRKNYSPDRYQQPNTQVLPQVTIINKDHFLKVPELSSHSISQRKNILSKLEQDYENMKVKLDDSNKKRVEKILSTPINNHNPKEDFAKEINNRKIQQNGISYFPDLYMINKNREKAIKSTLLQNKYVKPIHEDTTDDNLIEKWAQAMPQQKLFFQNIKNSIVTNRKRVIQQKGYLSNLYYELVALSPDQKRKIKEINNFGPTSPYKNLL